MYGYRPKISMLRSLCVPGYWDKWSYAKSRYDMDYNKMNSPCSLRDAAPPSLPMAVLRMNDKVAHTSEDRVDMRSQGMYTSVAHTIANTMLHPHYAFWEAPYNEDKPRRKAAKYSTTPLNQTPRPFMPHVERPELTETIGKIMQSVVRLQVGLTGEALDDERDVVRRWVLDVLIPSRATRESVQEPSLLRLVPYFSDLLLYVSRRMDIFSLDERMKIQSWVHRLAYQLARLAGKSDPSPAEFHKRLTLWEQTTGTHPVPYVLTAESMWRWIALLSTSPWVLHNIAHAEYADTGDGSETVPLLSLVPVRYNSRRDLRLSIANSIIELAHIVHISITVSPVDERRYVAMGDREEACGLKTLQHLRGLLLATSLVEKHGFHIVNENFCPAVSYFVADRTPDAWRADCESIAWLSFNKRAPEPNLDFDRQRVYVHSDVVCKTRPAVTINETTPASTSDTMDWFSNWRI